MLKKRKILLKAKKKKKVSKKKKGMKKSEEIYRIYRIPTTTALLCTLSESQKENKEREKDRKLI